MQTEGVHFLNPLISVVIPSYNREKLLPRAIRSVLSQSFQDFELIIVDDASVDSTEIIVSEIHDSRIRYHKHKVNKGQNGALNTGLSLAKGHYVSFLDSDDEWLPDFLLKLLNYLKKGEFDCVYCEAKWATGGGTVKEFFVEGDIYSVALNQGYISHMITILARTQDVRSCGGFDENFTVCQDDDLCIRLAKFCKFGLLKEQLAIVHNDAEIRSFSSLNAYADGWRKLFLKFKDEIFKECGSKTLSGHFMDVAMMYIEANNFIMAKEMFDIASESTSVIRLGRVVFYLPSSTQSFALRVWRKVLRVLGVLK